MTNTKQANQVNCILRPAKAAHFLGVSVPTLYRWSSQGRLPRPIKLGLRTSGWRLADLEAFLDKKEQESAQGATYDE